MMFICEPWSNRQRILSVIKLSRCIRNGVKRSTTLKTRIRNLDVNIKMTQRLSNARLSKTNQFFNRVSGLRCTAMILAFLLSLFVYLFSKEPIYLKNDYGYILNILSGGTAGEPFHNVFFMSPALGRLVELLYAHTSGFFPWFSIICYLTYLTGLYLLVRTILKYIGNHWIKLMFFLVLIVYFQTFGSFLNVFLLSLHLFISTLIYNFFFTFFEDKINPIKLLLTGLLFAVAYCFRPIFWNFMLIFIFPLVIILVLDKRIKYFLIIALGFLALFIPVTIVSNKLNDNYNHQAFYDYSIARSDIMDTNKGKLEGEELDKALAAAEWSENDYKMLLNWQLVDETVFNTQTCQTFIDIGDKSYINLNGLKDIYRAPEPKFYLTLCFGAFLLALFTKGKKEPAIYFNNKKYNWLMLLLPLYYLGGTLMLFAIRFNVNMMFGMFLLVFFTIPLAFSVLNREGLMINRPKIKGKTRLAGLIRTGVVIGVVFFMLVFNRYVLNGHDNNLGKMGYYFGKPFSSAERYNTQITAIDTQYNAPYIILPTSVMSDFPMVYTCLPFLEYRDFKKSDWVPVAWRAQSEYFYKLLSEHGYTSGSDMLEALASGDTSIVVFSSGSDKKIAEEKAMLYTFLIEHYEDALSLSGAEYQLIYKDENSEFNVLAPSESRCE